MDTLTGCTREFTGVWTHLLGVQESSLGVWAHLLGVQGSSLGYGHIYWVYKGAHWGMDTFTGCTGVFTGV